MLLPLVTVTTEAICVNLAAVRIRHNDSAKLPANGTPCDVGTGIGRSLVINNNGNALGVTEVQGAIGEAVVDGIIDAVRARVSYGELVHDNPLVDRWDELHYGHAGTRDVFVVRDVVHGLVPVLQVRGHLMGQLLTVVRIPLVRVETNQGVFVWPDYRYQLLNVWYMKICKWAGG